MASEIAEPDVADDRSVGIVQTQYAELFQPPAPLVLESGERLGPIRVAYETYGELSPRADNAIFVCHAADGGRASPGGTRWRARRAAGGTAWSAPARRSTPTGTS